MIKPLKLLIVSAHPNELVSLFPVGKKYQQIKEGVAFLAAGVGPVAVTFGLTHFLEDYRPKHILSIGTAGAINPKLNIGDLVIGKKVSVVSGDQHTYVLPVNTSLTISHNQGKLPSVSVFCPQEISCSENKRKELLLQGYDVENLESYALAFVAKKFKIPLISFLGITNIVGPQGHKEWLKNEARVCKKLARHVQRLLKTSCA